RLSRGLPGAVLGASVDHRPRGARRIFAAARADHDLDGGRLILRVARGKSERRRTRARDEALLSLLPRIVLPRRSLQLRSAPRQLSLSRRRADRIPRLRLLAPLPGRSAALMDRVL